MRKAFIIALLISLLLTGCTSQPDEVQPTSPANMDPAPESSTPQEIGTPEAIVDLQDEIEICLSNPDHPIGLEISANYADLTSYEEVMDWFCNGFEFEDIITALQTAEISDFHSEILLTMIEYGQSWEEIWAEIGLE